MHRTFAAALLLAATVLPAQAADDDAWAPARTGSILCRSPDFEKKTCDGLSLVSFDAQGFMHTEDQWIQPEVANDVVISLASTANLKNGWSCMVYEDALIDGARFTRNGQAIAEAEAAGYRNKLKGALTDVIGHELCMRLSPYGDSYSAQMSLDGFEIAAATRWVAWVKPGDGYQLVSP